MLTLYKFLTGAAYVLLQPYLALRKSKAPDEWRQRLVRDVEALPEPPATDMPYGDMTGPCLFHASSVGEVRVLERLIDAMKKIIPDMPYCVSTYTRTGNRLARELFDDAEAVFYFPLDCHAPLKRFFNEYRPRGVVIVETEIWPYFLDFCLRNEIPVVHANGRLSPGSVRWYRLFRGSLRRLFQVYRAFLVQTHADKERMIAIGADPKKIRVLGNIKHDLDESIDIEAKRTEVRGRLGLDESKFFFVAASTRPGEEEIICRALRSVPGFPERVTAMIAPRHLDRLEEVQNILTENDCPFTPYSRLKPGEPSPTPVILMDKIGLLADLFFGADLAFVGGTLADLGGHNVMEPVLAGVPTLFGPSISNVRDAAERIIDENLGGMIHNGDELAAAIESCVAGKKTYGRIKPGEFSVAEETARVIIREFKL
jgi:3-deoxy-D-manno-octulosonic-acid transferase